MTPDAKKIRLYVPLIVLGLLGAVLFQGLWLDPKKLPSQFIGRTLPAAVLERLPMAEGLASNVSRNTADFQGKPWVLNVFASWCQACLVEHAHLLSLAKQGQVRLVGLAYKDEGDNTRRWLAEHGNPYSEVLMDPRGQYGIELGVYGVPETFFMDAANTVVYKHVGPLTAEQLTVQLNAQLSAVNAASKETRAQGATP